jgi:hypothetical protein
MRRENHTATNADATSIQNIDPLELLKPKVNRRRAPRKNVVLRGKLVCAGSTEGIDCTIRDISATGAGIRLIGDQPATDRVFMIVIRDGVAHEGEIRWRSRQKLGLHFTRSYSLAGDMPSDMKFLKALWDRPEFHTGVGRELSRVAVYRGSRISVIPVDGGYAAFARRLDAPVDAGVNLGDRLTVHPQSTVERALAAARVTIDSGIASR